MLDGEKLLPRMVEWIFIYLFGISSYAWLQENTKKMGNKKQKKMIFSCLVDGKQKLSNIIKIKYELTHFKRN